LDKELLSQRIKLWSQKIKFLIKIQLKKKI